MATPPPDSDPDGAEPASHVFRRVREIDHAVLTCIRDGDDTTRQINQRTSDQLSKHQINYSFQKLKNHDLIVVTQRDGYTTSILDSGETRTHRKSKQASLTPTGRDYFDWDGRNPGLGTYDPETAATLKQSVAHLEDELAQVRTELQNHKQVLRQLRTAGNLEQSVAHLEDELAQVRTELQNHKQVLHQLRTAGNGRPAHSND
jgi:hypothetical protein